MSYNSSSPKSPYDYLASSKSSKQLGDPIRERKVSEYSSKNRGFDYEKPDHDSNSFLRSTMGSYSSRPNRELFESAAIESDRKK